MCLLTYLSSQEQLPDVQELFKNADKVAHFGVYFILGLFLNYGLSKYFNKSFLFTSIISIVVGITFSFIDEYHQSFVPNRVSDSLDLVADTLGILLSSFIYRYLLSSYSTFLQKIIKR
ncbi:MAG TPA: VanZ family protein [Candidatus Kapabacteria bacterium]|nr:VanZ family protein [Candidatus Kapabacteria bacterium]